MPQLAKSDGHKLLQQAIDRGWLSNFTVTLSDVEAVLTSVSNGIAQVSGPISALQCPSRSSCEYPRCPAIQIDLQPPHCPLVQIERLVNSLHH